MTSMKILDSKNNAISSIIYFDDVSVMLFSVKSLIVLNESNSITASCSPNSDFNLCTNDNGLLRTQKTLISNSTTSIVLDSTQYYVHNINVACNSKEAKESIDDIIIDNVAFRAVCNIVDDEDKYAVLLSNNKFYITDEFLKAFKDSNVDEHYADKLLLNQKRKELLLDLFSIKSFIGTYAGLINALKYFGYDDDVIIKEFWSYFDKNLQDYVLVAKNIQEDVNTLNAGFIKTNMFNLTYRANDVSGYYNDNDLPELIDIFSNDIVALIKMHNMRIVLETYFLPAHAVIVEIVGEHINFSSTSTSYYLHNAIINYYSTEIEKLFDTEIEERHQFMQVVLHESQNTAVLTQEDNAVRLTKIATIDDFDDNQMTFYYDNFAYCKITFNSTFYEFIKSAKIIVTNSANENIFETVVDDNNIIIGFLHNDDYVVNVFAIDSYNVSHLHTIKLSTYFAKHDFDIFTTNNKLILPEFIEKHEFSSTKEAFEYFDFKDKYYAFIADKTKIQYKALTSLYAYDKFGQTDAVGIPSYKDYNDNQYPLLQDMVANTTPYRYMQSSADNVDSFIVSKAEYANAHQELRRFLNKGFLSFYFELSTGQNIMSVTINDSACQFTVDIPSLANINTVASIVVNKFYSDKLSNLATLHDLLNFDVYVYNLIDGENIKPIAMFVSKDAVDIFDTTCNIQHEFKQISVDTNAIQYAHVITAASGSLECIVNNTSYSIIASINNADDLLAAISALTNTYEDLRMMTAIKHNDSAVIAFNQSYVLKHQAFGTIGCFARQHTVNDLIKLEHGSDIMQYSIVFAKINEIEKCRPHDIKWSLYENSGNSENLIVTSNNYFFSHVLKQKGSYTLVLEYKDKNDITYATHTVTKHGTFLVTDKFESQFDSTFVESSKYANI